jgi:hypothetical protein
MIHASSHFTLSHDLSLYTFHFALYTNCHFSRLYPSHHALHDFTLSTFIYAFSLYTFATLKSCGNLTALRSWTSCTYRVRGDIQIQVHLASALKTRSALALFQPFGITRRWKFQGNFKFWLSHCKTTGCAKKRIKTWIHSISSVMQISTAQLVM